MVVGVYLVRGGNVEGRIMAGMGLYANVLMIPALAVDHG